MDQDWELTALCVPVNAVHAEPSWLSAQHQQWLDDCRSEVERWPQYRGHIVMDGQGNTRIHLNVLTYFLVWTAFYVLRGSHGSATSEAARPARTLSLTPAFGSVKKVAPHPSMTRIMRSCVHVLTGLWATNAFPPKHCKGETSTQ